jgi:hypothetical protein
MTIATSPFLDFSFPPDWDGEHFAMPVVKMTREQLKAFLVPTPLDFEKAVAKAYETAATEGWAMMVDGKVLRSRDVMRDTLPTPPREIPPFHVVFEGFRPERPPLWFRRRALAIDLGYIWDFRS